MKLILTTVYEGVDQEFLDWWLTHNAPAYGLKKDNIQKGEAFTHVKKSKDPTSSVVGTTTIQLILKDSP